MCCDDSVRDKPKEEETPFLAYNRLKTFVVYLNFFKVLIICNWSISVKQQKVYCYFLQTAQKLYFDKLKFTKKFYIQKTIAFCNFNKKIDKSLDIFDHEKFVKHIIKNSSSLNAYFSLLISNAAVCCDELCYLFAVIK